MAKKYVLIVDDAKDILFLLTHSVKRLGPDYEVSTAIDGQMALEQLQKQRFDLIITDYMMPGMTGLELAQEVRRISPDTQVVLMTAYDTATLRDRAEDMHIGGYVGKPFTVPQILAMVERIVAQASEVTHLEPVEAPAMDQAVSEQLKTLRTKTGAHYVLLLNSDGHPLQVVGQADHVKVARVASFIAANFMAATELASLLGDNASVFKSSYYEGSQYNIYAYDVNGTFLLGVVFGTTGKPGTVWFYTKQAAAALATLLGDDTGETGPTGDFNASVAAEFNDLLGDE